MAPRSTRSARNGAELETPHTPDDDPKAKDATEEELEKLVFGDDASFREGLKEVALYESDEEISEGGETGEDEEEEDQGLEAVADADLFFFDADPSKEQKALAIVPQDDDDNSVHGDHPPAWEDSDDERISVSLSNNPRLRKLRVSEVEDVVSGKEYVKRLRRQFERLYPVPEWALPSASRKPRKRRRLSDESSNHSSSGDEMELDDEETSSQPLSELLRSSQGFIKQAESTPGKLGKLKPDVLAIQRSKDIPGLQPSSIESLSFHPIYPILLSSGPASTLYMHHISPSSQPPHPLLTSLHIRKTPLTTTCFTPHTGDRVFLSARRRFFHIWNLETGLVEKITRVQGHQEEQRSMERFKLSPCGRWVGLVGSSRRRGGVVNVLDAATLQWVAQVRIDSNLGVADFAWWADGEGLCVVGKNGEVSEWEVASRRIIARWTDEGAVGTTVLALGGKIAENKGLGDHRWVAIGSSSGIVNIYDRRSWSADDLPSQPKPTRVIDNLTTPTSHLLFSPDGQLLAMGSRWKRDALRLVHLPSCTVYRNWPTSQTPLGRITAVAFSPHSDALAVANEQGKIRLWEIRA